MSSRPPGDRLLRQGFPRVFSPWARVGKYNFFSALFPSVLGELPQMLCLTRSDVPTASPPPPADLYRDFSPLFLFPPRCLSQVFPNPFLGAGPGAEARNMVHDYFSAP